jgi:eukaryotic-like serine/threonine-protein kinase
MPLSIGDKLGPYEILAPIGAGGMGEVYRARDPRLNRDVAIKVSAAQFSERFEREARAIAALNHPNICQIYDVGPNYLVMEFIEGAPLRGPLPLDEALRCAVQIADAVCAAHAKGITHRDLKPGNIMVSVEGAVKLLDFGLAKRGDPDQSIGSFSTVTLAATEPGMVVGTVAYMSPEQAQGLAVDARSDIFSFGLVLYEMLSGRRAFTGGSALAIMTAILHNQAEPLDAPPAVQSILARCLRKSPAERFPSMEHVKQALLAITSGVASPVERAPSIAVLPFANMSADKEQEFFSDGLAEEILNALAKMPGLKVIARTSAFAFKGQNSDIRRIAETLGVTNVLEGSVRRAGNRIRVTAQLVAAVDGSHLWSERYDRELADVFAVQDEMAHAIASALHLKLSAGPAVPQRYTPKLPAYEMFLKGRHSYAKFTPDGVARGKEYLEQAIALDPQFAQAYSWLAECILGLARYGLMPAREAVPIIRVSAQKALDLDPSLPGAHALMAVVAGLHDHDWKEAERQFGLAMAQDPVPLDVRIWYAHSFLVPIGRAREAARQLKSVRHEDPVNAVFQFILAACLLCADTETEAAEIFRHVLDLEENFPPALIWLGHQYASQGMIPEALGCAERAFSLIPWNAEAIGGFAGLLKRTGNHSKAEELMQQLGDGQAYGAPLGFAYFHLICGELDKAADSLEKAIEQRHFLVTHYLWSPLAKPLRESPRWFKLAKLMNLPERAS